MHIRYFEKRPGAWHIDFRDNTGARMRPYAGATKAEAERNAPNAIAGALRPSSGPEGPSIAGPVRTATPRRPPANRATLREAFDLVFAAKVGRLKTSGLRTLAQTFDQLGLDEQFPVRLLDRVKVLELFETWKAQPGRRTGTRLDPGTINNRLSLLSAVLEVSGLPAHGVKHIAAKLRGPLRRVTDSDIAQARAWLAAEDHRPGAIGLSCLVACAIETGAREVELLCLRWEDYTGAEVTLRDPKTGRERTAKINPSATEAIERRRGVTGGPFADLDHRQVSELWADMQTGIGLEGLHRFTLQALRHEFASRLVDSGVDPFTILQRMAAV